MWLSNVEDFSVSMRPTRSLTLEERKPIEQRANAQELARVLHTGT
jgi:hypothetical protein